MIGRLHRCSGCQTDCEMLIVHLRPCQWLHPLLLADCGSIALGPDHVKRARCLHLKRHRRTLIYSRRFCSSNLSPSNNQTSYCATVARSIFADRSISVRQASNMSRPFSRNDKDSVHQQFCPPMIRPVSIRPASIRPATIRPASSATTIRQQWVALAQEMQEQKDKTDTKTTCINKRNKPYLCWYYSFIPRTIAVVGAAPPPRAGRSDRPGPPTHASRHCSCRSSC
jgi:hypothetical protein